MASGKVRGKNFSDAENRQLCISWLVISEDPIRGTDQSCSTFWSTIFEHAKKYVSSFDSRSPDGLRQRWGVISRSVSKFTGCFRAVIRLNESGTNEDDKIDKAKKMYQQDLKEDFKFMECWEILRKSPKFSADNHTAAISTPKSSQSRMETSPTMSPDIPLSRPLGRNSAKTNLKSVELETRRVEALEKIAAASEEKVRSFKEYTEALRQDNLIKLATIRMEDLDETSASLIKLHKEKLLAEMCAEIDENEPTEDYSGNFDNQQQGHEGRLGTDDDYQQQGHEDYSGNFDNQQQGHEGRLGTDDDYQQQGHEDYSGNFDNQQQGHEGRLGTDDDYQQQGHEEWLNNDDDTDVV